MDNEDNIGDGISLSEFRSIAGGIQMPAKTGNSDLRSLPTTYTAEEILPTLYRKCGVEPMAFVNDGDQIEVDGHSLVVHKLGHAYGFQDRTGKPRHFEGQRELQDEHIDSAKLRALAAENGITSRNFRRLLAKASKPEKRRRISVARGKL